MVNDVEGQVIGTGCGDAKCVLGVGAAFPEKTPYFSPSPHLDGVVRVSLSRPVRKSILFGLGDLS